MSKPNEEDVLDRADVSEKVEKRIVLLAEEGIEIRCGKASVVLTKDGKILVNGAHVSVSADGVVRLDGGAVQIN